MDLNTNNDYCAHCVEADDSSLPTEYEWVWDESTSLIKLSENNSNVTFHPIFSTGTAVARGNKPLEKDRHHFWEILMMTYISGTDVMVGVGTANAKINDVSEVFCSLLGRDQESWGFSYKGYLQHNGEVQSYKHYFSKGYLVGVHLDTWNGTLQFFLNRKSLGVAFTNLHNVTLYPLISCTMAQCTMKLTYSCSIPVSLQTTCLEILSPMQRTYLSKTYPGLNRFYQSIFVDMLQKHIDYDDEDNIEFLEEQDVILDDFDYALVGVKRKKRRKCSIKSACVKRRLQGIVKL